MSAPSKPRGHDEAVIEEIRVAMARRRWRQSELARQLGVSEVWVSRRLTGKTDISVGELYRIAEALGVTVFDLLPDKVSRSEVTLGYPVVTQGGSSRGVLDNRPSGHAPIKRSVRVSEPLAA